MKIRVDDAIAAFIQQYGIGIQDHTFRGLRLQRVGQITIGEGKALGPAAVVVGLNARFLPQLYGIDTTHDIAGSEK